MEKRVFFMAINEGFVSTGYILLIILQLILAFIVGYFVYFTTIDNEALQSTAQLSLWGYGAASAFIIFINIWRAEYSWIGYMAYEVVKAVFAILGCMSAVYMLYLAYASCIAHIHNQFLPNTISILAGVHIIVLILLFKVFSKKSDTQLS